MADLIEIAKLLGPGAVGLLAIVVLWRLIAQPEIAAARDALRETSKSIESVARSMHTTAEAIATVAKRLGNGGAP
ncbi:MAG: hypothetical protein KF768_13495 [Phycisphaeraceae bacterium]|nr:hypothetical protein [Phycisphaeraceae bacterium]